MNTCNQPLVTAVMLTGYRPERTPLAELAIKCFQRQTYENRELLILNTGPSLKTESPNIREILCSHPPTLGELRNIAIENAAGDLLINWDDDDWYHPGRIARQVAAYKPGHIVLLRSQIRLNLLNGDICQVDWSFGIFGTMLWPRGPKRFPSINQGEDLFFVESFPNSRIVVRNPPDLYVRVYHGANVCTEDHMMKARSVKAITDEQAANINENILPEYRQLGFDLKPQGRFLTH